MKVDWEPFVQYIKDKTKYHCMYKLVLVYAIGVGPGSPEYLTDLVKKVIIESCDVVAGYKYTLQDNSII